MNAIEATTVTMQIGERTIEVKVPSLTFNDADIGIMYMQKMGSSHVDAKAQ